MWLLAAPSNEMIDVEAERRRRKRVFDCDYWLPFANWEIGQCDQHQAEVEDNVFSHEPRLGSSLPTG